MRGRTALYAIALPVVAAGVLVSGPAGAEAASGCGDPTGICLYSGTNETGTQVTVPRRTACTTVASLGIPAARSAVDGNVSFVLRLYSDTNCQTPADPAFVITSNGVADSITPAAQSVNLLPIPGA